MTRDQRYTGKLTFDQLVLELFPFQTRSDDLLDELAVLLVDLSQAAFELPDLPR